MAEGQAHLGIGMGMGIGVQEEGDPNAAAAAAAASIAAADHNQGYDDKGMDHYDYERHQHEAAAYQGQGDNTDDPYYGEMPEGGEDSHGKIFIGGVSWQTQEIGLRKYFEKFGELDDVALMTDKKTNQPRGFGFVTFKDPSGACLLTHPCCSGVPKIPKKLNFWSLL